MKNVFARISELLDNPGFTKGEIYCHDFLDDFCEAYGFKFPSVSDMALEDFIEKYYDSLIESSDPVDFFNRYELDPEFGHLDFSSDWFWQVYFSEFHPKALQGIFISYCIRPEVLTKYSGIIEKKLCSQDSFEARLLWDKLSLEQTLEEEFIRKEWKYLDQLAISYTQSLSEKFMEDYQDYLDWGIICNRQKLSSDFIKRNKTLLSSYIDLMDGNKEIGLSRTELEELLK